MAAESNQENDVLKYKIRTLEAKQDLSQEPNESLSVVNELQKNNKRLQKDLVATKR